MDKPRIVSRGEWLEERKALLQQEKAFTKERDRLNAARRALPLPISYIPSSISAARSAA